MCVSHEQRIKKNLAESKMMPVFSVIRIKAQHIETLNNIIWLKLKTAENNSTYYHELKPFNVIKI